MTGMCAMLLLSLAGARAAAQPVRLQIRPRVGDTLRMRLDQQVEMTSTSKFGGTDSTTAVASAMHVIARAIVRRAEAGSTLVEARTDSVVMMSSDGETLASGEQARRAMQGRKVLLRIAPDGGTEVVADGSELATPALRQLFASMPPMLPRDAVSVGERWKKTLELPDAEAGHGSVMHATFRLDSLSGDDGIAYVTLNGTISRDPPVTGFPKGTKFVMSGVVNGTVQVDRRRGWITDSHITLVVRSTVSPPPSAGPVMNMRMTVTQWMRALDRK